DPYLTHPPLHERLEAIAPLPAEPRAGSPPLPAEDPPAVALLDNLDALEDQLLRAVFDERKVAKLQPIRWEDLGDKVYLPLWTKTAVRARSKLQGLTPAALPERLPELERLGRDQAEAPGGKDEMRSHGAF